MSLIKSTFFVLILIFLGCKPFQNKGSNNHESDADSIEIANLLTEMYKWYIPDESEIFYDVVVKDSFQIGIDTIKLKKAITKLENSNFFNQEFITNYERIAMAVDSILKNGKYYNEINFTFQDADIWTSSQDDESNLWKEIKIKDLEISGNESSLEWYRDSDKDFGYHVKMKKENGKWKISYLEGLDFKNIIAG